MRKLTAFIILSLNGYYKDADNSLNWHHHDEEGLALSLENLRSDGHSLLLGRKTYQAFESFWNTPAAFESFPEIAKRMRQAEKIVFSQNLKDVNWENSRFAQHDLVSEVKALKNGSGGGMTVLGSASIVQQLSKHNLIDEFQLLVDPVVINGGAPLFEGLEQNLKLRLLESRTFKSGAVFLHYQSNL